ncbi:MAG: ribosome maturation factor RimP, partial [Clostridia bacterium]|nr:ribosome maturation factor RimP [Clostridia bacterium]
SAGLDRQLKRESDFLAFLGSEVDVKLYAPIDGKKEFCATLLKYNDGIVTLECDGKEIEVSLDKTASIRLAVIF